MIAPIIVAGAIVATAAGVRFDQHLGATLPLQGIAPNTADAPTVLVFGYGGCRNLCPTIVRGVAESLQATGLKPGKDYRALFVSIDAADTDQRLKGLEAQVLAAQRPAWRFVRPDPAATHRLMRAAGFVSQPAQDGQIAHASGIVVVSPQARVIQYLFGVRFDPVELAAALERARKDTTGPPALQLLLTCLHLDPANGKATAVVLSALRAACLLFAAVVAFWLWRRQGRAAA